MDCDFIRANLTQLLENKVLPETQNRINAHLESCQGCRHLVAQYVKIWEMWDEPFEITPSPAFWPNLLQRVQASESNKLSKLFFFSRHPYRFRPIAAAAFLFLGILLGYHLGNFPVPEKSQGSDQPDSAKEQFVEDQVGMFDDFPEGSLVESYLDLGQNNG